MSIYFVDRSIIFENAKIVSKENDAYKTNLKFHGISIYINMDNENEISNLESDFKFIKTKLKSIIEEEFEKLYTQGIDDYDMEVDSVKDLIKLAGNPDYIEYSRFTKKNIGIFELYFNNSKSNHKFFKNHTVIISVNIKNSNQLGSVKTSIEG